MYLHLMSVGKELFHPKVTFLLLLFPLPFCIVQQLFQNPLLHSFGREKFSKWEYNLLTILNDLTGYRKTRKRNKKKMFFFPSWRLKNWRFLIISFLYRKSYICWIVSEFSKMPTITEFPRLFQPIASHLTIWQNINKWKKKSTWNLPKSVETY